MTDIIANAQRLLDGATPAPWEWVGYSIESEHGMVLDFQCVTAFGLSGASREVEVTPEDEELIAAAPEHTKALAEETWEYAVQVKRTESEEWRLLSFKLPFITHKTMWFSSQSEAEHERQEQVPKQVSSRIVRRRVSPPEVLPNTTINPAAAGTTESDK